MQTVNNRENLQHKNDKSERKKQNPKDYAIILQILSSVQFTPQLNSSPSLFACSSQCFDLAHLTLSSHPLIVSMFQFENNELTQHFIFKGCWEAADAKVIVKKI